jgi:hypothetical protein
MNTSDLRIGNYLMDCKGRLCQVEKIENRKFTAPAIHGAITTVVPKQIPIRLTTDWLTELGFKQIDRYTFVRNGLFIHKRKTGFKWGKVKVEFVHKLQNIFWVCKELELRLQIKSPFKK